VSLNGCYISAEDVGCTAVDIENMFSRTRFTTCIPKEIGGSGNPSKPTAWGVVSAMESALDFLGKGNLKGKTIVCQGLGNVSSFMVEALLSKEVKFIVANDIDPDAIAAAKERFKKVQNLEIRLAPKDDHSIFSENCDILATNALGGILNSATIPKIKAPIVCGAANNQILVSGVHDEMLRKAGITYVPDFICNRMGIVNCANEQYGYINDDPAVQKHFGRDWSNAVFNVTKKVLQRAKVENISTEKAAHKIADELSEEMHPIWPHRGLHIVQSLVAENWHTHAMEKDLSSLGFFY